MFDKAEDNSDRLLLHPEQQENFAPLRPSWGFQGMHHCYYLIVFLAVDVPVGRFPSSNSLVPPQGCRKPHPVMALRAEAQRGAYRLFPTDLHVPPIPWRSDLLTTSTSTQAAAAQEERLERRPGDSPSERKTNQGNLPQAWMPPITDKVFHAASCATPLRGQCQDPMNRAVQT